MAEAVMTGAASGGIVEIGKWACKLMKRHIEYLFCYRQKVDKLNEKISKELAPNKADIQLQVEAAERRGDTVTNVAKQWGDDFEELERLNKENVDGAAAAPCFCWGYRFGKRAAHGLDVADGLKLRAAGLVTPGVFLPAPAPAAEVRLPIDGFQELGTTASCMESVMRNLRNGSPGLIGVHGMGGVGKSFLVKKVLHRAQAEGLFKEVVFAVVSQDVNVKMIQQQIAEVFDINNVTQMTELKGAAIVRERLTNFKGRVLLVLDDLWQTLDISLVGIPTEVDSSCANYKVVITTRDRDVCNRMGCNEIIELTTLSEDESWELFRITSGVDDDAGVTSGPGIIEMARSAAKKCGGLPLALTVLGKTTKGYRNAEEWRSVAKELDELRPIKMKGVRDDLYQIVKVSFDRLHSEEERLCFLFLCLFPEDYCISLNNHDIFGDLGPFEILLPTYTWYAVGEGFLENWDTLAEAQERVGNILLRLKNCGLLIDGDNKGKESVKMHDVVRHVALLIAAGDGYGLYSKAGVALQQWPIISNLDLIQRISLVSTKCKNRDDYFDGLGLLPNDMDCPRLRTLTLAHNLILKDIPDDFFSKMKALQVLDLNMDRVSSFPSSLSSLTNLRVLFLSGGYRYNDTDLIIISSLTNLVILSIRGGRISLFPKEMGNLSRLRCLDLMGCEVLMMPPNVLSKLSNLEQLYMIGSFDEWRVQEDSTDRGAAFVELARLRRLTHLYVNVENKECLWQEFDSDDPWPDLTEFHIRRNISEFHRTFRFIAPRRTKAELWLDGGNYNALLLPGWLKRLMTRTKKLALIDCGTLDIPASNFSFMENLIINGIGNPGMLFNAGESFPNLKWLHVSDCCNITGIFASDNTLLPKVESIELYYLPQLTRICQEGDLRCPNLTELTVNKCNSLTHILGCQRDGVLCTPNLTELTVNKCNSLTHILGCQRDGVVCPNLKKLAVEECRALKAIIATSVEELEEIEEEATMLQQQDNSFLPRLQKLTLTSLPLLTKLHQAGNINNNSTPAIFIPSLQEIIVIDCPQLEALHLGLESLTNISIDNSRNLCNSLSSSDFCSRAPLLKEVALVRMEELYEIFSRAPMLPVLTKMRLESLPQLISIFAVDDIPYGSFQNLIQLEIFNCNSMSIFSKRLAAQCLPQLKELTIVYCYALKELIMFEEEEEEEDDDEKAVLPRLEKIIIRGCHNLEKALVPELLPSLENLQSIKIKDCLNLSEVLDCNIRFQRQTPLLPLLRCILLWDLPQLTSIWHGDVPNGSLPSLERVVIDRCDQLSNLFTWRQARCLQRLEALQFVKCRALKDVIMPMHVDEEEITDENKNLLPQREECTLSDVPLSNSYIRADTPSILLPALKDFNVNKCPLLKTSPLGRENLVRCLSFTSDEDYDDNDEIGTQEGSPSQ